jgi:hypothetical protein
MEMKMTDRHGRPSGVRWAMATTVTCVALLGLTDCTGASDAKGKSSAASSTVTTTAAPGRQPS